MIAALLVASTWVVAVPNLAPSPVRYAIVIGHNGGPPDTRPPLSFADDDAARFFLLQLPSVELAFLLTTFDRDSAKVFGDLTDLARPATAKELARVMGEISWKIRNRKKQGLRTELVFYFAGHGDVSDSGEGYVVLADQPFTRSDLDNQIVQASPADINHLIIDACASYFMTHSRGGDQAQSGAVQLSPTHLNILKGKASGDNTAWSRTGTLVSTGNAAEVHESAELSAGIFSYLLRSALSGAADTSGDGKVEYAEAAAFIAAAGAGIADPRAQLNVVAEAPLQQPHAALADVLNSGAQHFLALDGSSKVRMRILDARGTPYVEFHRGEGQPALIALAGSPYYIVQMGTEEAVLVPRHAGAYSLRSLDFVQQPAPRGGQIGNPYGHLSGLFQTGLDDSFVEGFLSHSMLPKPRDNPALQIVYAPGAQPPLQLPLLPIGTGALVAAGTFGALAVVGTMGNLTSYSELVSHFEATGQVDQDLAMQAETWRTVTGIAVFGAAFLTLAGGSIITFAVLKEAEGQP